MLGAHIDVLTMAETVAQVDQYIRRREPLHLMGVNADKINQMYRDAAFAALVNACGIINADGASVVLASRLLKKPLPERVAGIDLMQALLALSQEQGYRIFFLGAAQNTLDALLAVMQRAYPTLHVVGAQNGYFYDSETVEISKTLQAADPDIVFVGISSPRKEQLIQFFQAQGHAAVFMGVGGSFDVLSGKVRRAPAWMQRLHMEWLFRMLQEPRRLFARYVFGNLRFLGHVLREKFCPRQ